MISVAIPVLNEERGLTRLLDRLTAVLEGIGRPWEVIFVDDGSKDNTAAMLQSPGKPLPGGAALRNRSSCVQAAQLNALGELAFRMASASGQSGDLNFQIPAPRFRTGRCIAPSSSWNSCTCEVMLYAPGLRTDLSAAIAGG